MEAIKYVEFDYDNDHSMLKVKFDDKVIDIKVNKDVNNKEEAMNDIMMKYVKQLEVKRTNSAVYAKRMATDEQYQEKAKQYKSQWFQDNKERLKGEQLEKYKNVPEYRERINQKNKRAYERRTEGVEKQKRGRKPKPQDTPVEA